MREKKNPEKKMVTENLTAVEMLLKQQQEFTTNLLAQQELWMQTFLEKKSESSQAAELTTEHQMVPAFYKFSNNGTHTYNNYSNIFQHTRYRQ